MMKRILIIVFLLVLNFTLKAQILQQPNTYGIGWKRTGADTLLYIPSDTLQVPSWGVGKAHIAKKGTSLYYWDGSKWSAISGSGGTYAAGNGLTLSGSQFKLGGTLTENTTITTTGYDFNLPGIPTVSSTTRRKVALIDTVTGKVERIDPASLATTSLPISSLTAATGTNDINNGANQQTWRWNNKGLGHGIFMVSNSTSQPTGENGALLSIAVNGTHSNSSVISTGIQSNVTNIGTSSTNRAAYFYAANATNNYAIIVPSGGGRVGLGTTTPNASALLDVTSTTQGAVLPRMNTTQMNAISSPVAGLMVYNSDSTSYCYYNGSAWLKMGSSTPTLQQVLTAGSNVSNPVDIRFNGNELNVIQTSDLKRIFTFSDDDAIYIDNLNNGQSNVSINTNDVEIYRALGGREFLGGRESTVKVTADSIILKPNEGKLNIDSLRTWSGISDTTHKKLMTWDTRNGRWEYAANWYGGGGGTVSSASGTGVSLVNGSSQIKRLKAGTGITITDNTDSVTINRVTDSTVVRNLRWKYRNTFELMDEFLGNGVAPGWNSQSSGAGSSAGTSDFAFADLDTTWQGATYASTGTTTTGKGLGMYGNTTSSNTGSFRGYNTSFAVYETRVRFDTLSNTTNEYSALFGWMDWFGSSFYQKGMKFVYDRATYGDYWVLRSDDGGTSAVVTTTAVAAKTDYVLRIEVYNWQMGSSGGSIKAYINDVEVVASSGTYPIVSNIAKTDTFYPCYWIQKSAGTVARKVFLDWVYQYAEFIKRL